ncbi:MAG: amino acid ABC transporter substrate-binding protein [Anaerolineae bacterium CG2_30_64_16]|nr:MAG: amino acid ABC transporter substrate-binding protein [Anaerolineae bacterium CG2_30_64_16]
MFVRKLTPALVALVLFTMVLASCAPAPAQPVEVTRVVEVTRIVEAPAAAAAATAVPAAGPKRLDVVKQRGKVVCGIHTSLAGFGYLDADGKNVGFDVDFCRAVAVAVFDDPNAVEFVPVSAAERGPALQTGEIDLLSRTATWTSSRDAQWGNFTVVMFYDGQGMLVRKASGFTTLEDLDGATVCVTTGTTTELNLADAFRQRGLQFTAVTFEDTPSVYGAYEQGRCDAATSDKSQLAAVRSGFANPEDHFIMDVTMSKEPLTPTVPQGDDQWFDIVKTVAFVLINAEELGVTSANVDEMLKSEDPSIKRMLGVEGSFGQADLGLSNDFAANIIRKVGNYGEMYDRYMGPEGLAFTLDRGLNKLWSNGGLIYAPPLR